MRQNFRFQRFFVWHFVHHWGVFLGFAALRQNYCLSASFIKSSIWENYAKFSSVKGARTKASQIRHGAVPPLGGAGFFFGHLHHLPYGEYLRFKTQIIDLYNYNKVFIQSADAPIDVNKIQEDFTQKGRNITSLFIPKDKNQKLEHFLHRCAGIPAFHLF